MKVSRHIVLLTPISLVAGLLIAMTSAVAADSRWATTGAQKPGVSDKPVWSIAVSPTHPAVMLAATQGHGVLRSDDSGATWTSVIPTVQNAWAVRFDPQQPLTAYAGSQSDGFFKSTDEGKTWTPQNAGLTNPDIRAIDAGTALVVVGTPQGVFYSSDAALTWHSLGLSSLSISSVGLLPRANGITIFAGADNGSAAGYLAKTDDLSGTWTVVKGNFPADAIVAAIAVATAPSGGTDPPVLAGTSQGLFRSDDRGSTWNAVGGLPSGDFNLALFNPANPDQIYVASDADQGNGGVFRSLDRGASWNSLGTGLPSKPRVTALAIQPQSPLQVVASVWNPTTDVVVTYRIADPAAAVAGASPSASASAAPSVAASGHASSFSFAPARRSSAPINYQPYAAAAGVLFALVIVIVARRWRMRREDRRTYAP